MDIGSLTGQIAIEDQVSERLTLIAKRVKDFAEEFDGAFGAMAIGVGVVSAAVTGAIISITALGEKGSTILGVENAFDHLAEAAGTTGEALFKGLNEGLRATIDSMELMQIVSRPLTAGIKLTADDMRVMGEAARAMGKATGTDASHGLQSLSSALTTGRTRALSMAGIIVDLEKAELAYAKSLGTTRSELSTSDKLEADRVAILNATRAYVDRLGVSELSFKEHIQQATVAIGNWFDTLAKSVAASPNVMRAMNAIEEAIRKAFGGDSQAALDTIVGWVNKFADAVERYGPFIIQTVADIWHEVVKLWHTVQAAWDLVPDWFKNIAKEAGLAAGAVYVTSRAFGVLGGGHDTIGTIASFATITSGTSDMVKAMIAGTPIIRNIGSAIQGLSVSEVVSISVSNLALSMKALAVSPVGIATLFVALGAALWEVNKAVQGFGENWKRGGGTLWGFLTLKDDDTFLRRWLGLSTTLPKVANGFDIVLPAVKNVTERIKELDSVTLAYNKSVQAVMDSVIKANREQNASRDAYSKLGNEILKTDASQRMFITDMDKIIASGRALTDVETQKYLVIARSHINIEGERIALLQLHGIRLTEIEALKAQGFSEQEIAVRYHTSAEAIKTVTDALVMRRQAELSSVNEELKFSTTTTQQAIKGFRDVYDAKIRQLQSMRGATQVDYAIARGDLERSIREQTTDMAFLASANRTTRMEDLANAINTYNEMALHAHLYSRDAFNTIRIRISDAQDALHQLSSSNTETFNLMKDTVDRTSDSFRAWWSNQATDAQKAAIGVDKYGHAIEFAGSSGEMAGIKIANSLGIANQVVGNSVTYFTRLGFAAANLQDAIAGIHSELLQLGGQFEVPDIAVNAGNVAQLRDEMERIRQGYLINPGRATGGTGSTGLSPSDSAGWKNMLDERVRYAALVKALGSYSSETAMAMTSAATVTSAAANVTDVAARVISYAADVIHTSTGAGVRASTAFGIGQLSNWTGSSSAVRATGSSIFGGSNPIPSKPFDRNTSVVVQPGAVVLNYPIMRDRQAMDHLGQVVGDAMVNRLINQGWRPPAKGIALT